MFPIALDLTKIPVLLIGRGELFQRRLQYLQEAGATELFCHSCEGRNSETYDVWQDIPQQVRDDSKIIMVAGLSRAQAAQIVEQAHDAGKLVNVEDINELCDFYFTANVRRGDLVIAVSTSGASPTLARKIRDRIAELFDEEWVGRVREMAQLRQRWKKEGVGFQGLIDNTERHLAETGWLREKEEAA